LPGLALALEMQSELGHKEYDKSGKIMLQVAAILIPKDK
jgi:hypothetical protein